jgi:hypothetical protein
MTHGHKVLAWSFVACSLMLASWGYVQRCRLENARMASPEPGPEPSGMFMTLAIRTAFRREATVPASMDGPILGAPAVDHLDGVGCWRFPFLYWADSGLGYATLHRGCFWVKDGRALRERWN